MNSLYKAKLIAFQGYVDMMKLELLECLSYFPFRMVHNSSISMTWWAMQDWPDHYIELNMFWNLLICYVLKHYLILQLSLIARFMGPTWGAPGADKTQVGPINFAIWGINWKHYRLSSLRRTLLMQADPVTSSRWFQVACGPFYWNGLTLILAWISNCIHYIMWDEIIYPFLNLNGATVEV